MHFVEFRLQPIKKSIDAIPLIVSFFVIGFTFHDEGNFIIGKLRPGNVRTYAVFFCSTLQITQTFTVDIAVKGSDCARVNGQAFIRDDQTVIDFDDASEATALFAGADWRIERKKRRNRRPIGNSRFRRVQALGKFSKRNTVLIQKM